MHVLRHVALYNIASASLPCVRAPRRVEPWQRLFLLAGVGHRKHADGNGSGGGGGWVPATPVVSAALGPGEESIYTVRTGTRL